MELPSNRHPSLYLGYYMDVSYLKQEGFETYRHKLKLALIKQNQCLLKYVLRHPFKERTVQKIVR